MHIQLRTTYVFVMATAVALSAGAQGRTVPHQATIQMHFSAEDEGVKSPVTIPPEVMVILGEDEMVKMQMENGEPRPAQVPHSWFSASKIRLGPTRRDDLIVQATGPLVGANVVAFWIFIHRQD